MALGGSPYEAPMRTMVGSAGVPIATDGSGNLTTSTASPAATSTNRSGTVTAGGTAQQLVAANAGRKGISVMNNSSGDLWINEQGTATASQPSLRIAPGQEYIFCSIYGYVPISAISIIGATTAQAFSAREW